MAELAGVNMFVGGDGVDADCDDDPVGSSTAAATTESSPARTSSIR